MLAVLIGICEISGYQRICGVRRLTKHVLLNQYVPYATLLSPFKEGVMFYVICYSSNCFKSSLRHLWQRPHCESNPLSFNAINQSHHLEESSTNKDRSILYQVYEDQVSS